MSREKILLKNSIIYLIGNFGSRFLGILMLPLYTHYLNKEQYGYFDLMITAIALLIPIITFQITDALYRYLLDSKDYKEKCRVITNSISIMILNLIFVNLIFLIIFRFKKFDYQYLFLEQLDVSILYSVWIQVARGLKQNVLYSVSGFIFTVISLLSNIAMIVCLHFGIEALILSNVFASTITFVYVECKIRIFKYINFKLLSKKSKLKLIKFSLPLVPNAVGWWFMSASDRFLLNHYMGMEANGIYAIANKFPSILIMLNFIFSLAWQESVITESKSKDNNEFNSKMFNLYVTIEFTGVIVLLAITKVIMRLLVDNSYYIAWRYIPFLYLGTIFSGFSVFYGASYLSSEKTLGSFYTSVIGAVINVIVNICLIPLIGIQGAAFSTMLSFLAMWILRIVDTKKFFNISINVKPLLTLSTITVIYTCLFYYENIVLEAILVLLSIVIFVLYNKILLIKFKEAILIKLKVLKR